MLLNNFHLAPVHHPPPPWQVDTPEVQKVKTLIRYCEACSGGWAGAATQPGHACTGSTPGNRLQAASGKRHAGTRQVVYKPGILPCHAVPSCACSWAHLRR